MAPSPACKCGTNEQAADHRLPPLNQSDGPVGESASGSVDLGFDSEFGQTNDFKIGIHSFPA